MDQRTVAMKYAVRGDITDKAAEIEKKLMEGEKLGFDSVIKCNIGNPHAVKQQPITFYRQVAAACMYPPLAEGGDFPSDVKARAKQYLEATGGSGVGSYTVSDGLQLVRDQVAAFLERRDGYPATSEHISLTTGASEGVKRTLAALITSEKDGVLIPMPQYPLYSASLTMYGGTAVYYDLDEDTNWSVSKDSLEAAASKAKADGVHLRAVAVINPGNPSGAVLEPEDVRMIIDFAKQQEIVILADEVYQENVYADGKSFNSFKKVLCQMKKSDGTYNEVQLVSYHSTSKGLIGECGQRGGYMEMVGFSERTMAQFTKVAATSLSSNTMGQIFMGMMVTPPKEGEPSYELFKKETGAIFEGLQRRSKMITEGINAIPGLSSAVVQGAMYAFPRIEIPVKAQAEAAAAGVAPDALWCLKLVEQTGIVCVPGSGFGQKEGTFHFRITILPPDDMLSSMLERLKAFHANFLDEYRDGPAAEVQGKDAAQQSSCGCTVQ